MKSIQYTIWGLVGLYGLLGIIQIIIAQNSGMDQAGKGMTIGFMAILLVYALIVGVLNLIKTKWVKKLTLVLALLPLVLIIGAILESLVA